MSQHEPERGVDAGPGGVERKGVSRRSFLQVVGAGALAALPGERVLGLAEEGRTEKASLGPGPVPIELRVNGRTLELEVEPRVTLLDALRDHVLVDPPQPVDLTGTKRVCDRGACGACTVIADGRTIYACTTLAIEARGRQIRTVEALARGEELHPLQEAVVRHDGSMCGFCTPGFVMSAVALLERNPSPDREEIRRALDGNLCRCGTQPRFLEAVEEAARRMRGGR